MDSNILKKILAGLSVAGLLAGASLTLSGCPKQTQQETSQGQSG